MTSRRFQFPNWWPARFRPRPPADAKEWIAAAVVVFFSVLLVGRLLLQALAALRGIWFLSPLPVIAAVAVWRIRHQARERSERARHSRMRELSLTAAELDGLSPTGFELATRDLMIRDGIRARHVGQRGDQAADVIGRCSATGLVWVAQCKHTTTGGRVSSQVMYQVKGTATPIHGADIAVVVTNGGYTRDARANAAQLGIHLIDRDQLLRWAEHGITLHELLGLQHEPNP